MIYFSALAFLELSAFLLLNCYDRTYHPKECSDFSNFSFEHAIRATALHYRRCISLDSSSGVFRKLNRALFTPSLECCHRLIARKPFWGEFIYFSQTGRRYGLVRWRTQEHRGVSWNNNYGVSWNIKRGIPWNINRGVYFFSYRFKNLFATYEGFQAAKLSQLARHRFISQPLRAFSVF